MTLKENTLLHTVYLYQKCNRYAFGKCLTFMYAKRSVKKTVIPLDTAIIV